MGKPANMYKGIMPPLVTPLCADGSTICERSVERLVESLRPYVSGYIACLSSGEGWKLDDEQWHNMARFTKKYAGATPVFVGIMRPVTDDVLRLAHRVEDLGVDGLAITSPFGETVTQDEILSHYHKVTSAIDLPILVYNESAISKNSTDFDVLMKIAALDSVVAIKESSGSIALTQKLMKAGLEVAIFQGWEHFCLKSDGVDGYVMALANVEPRMCLKMFETPTLEQQSEIINFCDKNGLFEDDWYAAIKTLLQARGVIAHCAVA